MATARPTAPTEPPPAAAALEEQHGSGCCWETWGAGKAAPERCGAETLPGCPWCWQHADRWRAGQRLTGRGHGLNAGASIRGVLYGSGT